MDKRLIGIGIMCAIVLILTCVNLLKRQVMRNFTEVNFKSMGFWFSLFTNPKIVFVLFLMVISFGLSVAIFFYLTVPSVTILGWMFAPFTFLLTLFLSHVILNESIKSSQWTGVWILSLATVIAVYGGYRFFYS